MPEKRSSRSEERSSSRSSERSSSSRSASERSTHHGEFRQGETPGPGEYRCVSCNADWRVTLREEKSRLPPCGKCGPGVTAEYERVGRER
ncbi:MAG: hypothetical protein ACE14P_03205 [Methanotrichaceae archaeon]